VTLVESNPVAVSVRTPVDIEALSSIISDVLHYSVMEHEMLVILGLPVSHIGWLSDFKSFALLS
jgi:hypothetical protein